MLLISTARLGSPWGADLAAWSTSYCLHIANLGTNDADLALALKFAGTNSEPPVSSFAHMGTVTSSREVADDIVTFTSRFRLGADRSTMVVVESSSSQEVLGTAWLGLEEPPGRIFHSAELLLHATQRYVRQTLRNNGTNHDGMVVVLQQEPGIVSSEPVPLATGSPIVTLELTTAPDPPAKSDPVTSALATDEWTWATRKEGPPEGPHWSSGKGF